MRETFSGRHRRQRDLRELRRPSERASAPGATVTAKLHRVPVDLYHRDGFCARPSLSSSIATTIVNQSAKHAHARHPRLGNLGGKPATKALDHGTLSHALVLGAGKEILRCDFDNWKTKRSQAIRDEARAAGLVPILAAEYEAAEVVALHIKAQLVERGIVLDGESEIAIEWEAESALGPVLCRGLMDHLIVKRAQIHDLKTSRDANPREFAKSCIRYGYDVQHTAYTQALETLHPELAGRIEMNFIVAELEPPYAIGVYTPDGFMREHGQRRWQRALDTWAGCLKSGTWPGYENTKYISVPRWALQQEEEAA